MTDDVPTIQEAVARVMADVRAVAKGDHATQQNFMFRGVDAVVNAVAPALRRHGVVVTPAVREVRTETVHVGRNQTPMGLVTVIVDYTLTGPRGDSLPGSSAGQAMDSGDKALPKAMSVAYRTWWLQALALPTDEVDPDAQTYERSSAPQVDPREEARQDLINQVGYAAKANGVNPEHVIESWARTHKGEHIREATDLAGLEQLLDLIQRGEFVPLEAEKA